MSKPFFKNTQKTVLADLTESMMSIFDLYRKTEDPDALKTALALFNLDLSISHYELKESTFRSIHRFVRDYLEKLSDLKLFAQFSTESILLYSNGPKVCDENEAEAFANSFYPSRTPKAQGVEVYYPAESRKYHDAFKQAAKEYYICFLGNKPDIYGTIADGKAFEIVATKAYELIEEIYKNSLISSDE